MTANEIRNKFFDFFASKQHKIVPSAPMVLKNDPTLMFTNAGMNQFKDIFLGNMPVKHKRIANSQKCLRVSGKHNDLDEVGLDTYHHTMFEMLGNWSFGDYFKQEAIDWAWELLTGVFSIPKDRLYATVFEGNPNEGVEMDSEAVRFWGKYLKNDRILTGSKKDNFWEMGDIGPCGPCSEIHIDLRSDNERQKTNGAELVNKDHPEVIEIWNLVFIQFNRKKDGSLEQLPKKHVDTGMGFERLCMVVENKKSNYDTAVFRPLIKKIEELSGKKYGKNKDTNIAIRVVADHIRTIAFAIADGQLPSNAKAGYVIRRILRRAVRYAYTFLNQTKPFMYELIPALIETMGEAYPELKTQRDIIERVVTEEEIAFLRTLDKGISMLDRIIKEAKRNHQMIVSGRDAFVLYDSYGFPLDLTELILREKGLSIDLKGYEKEMNKQKERSRSDATNIDKEDWVVVKELNESVFVGYDNTEYTSYITKYRKVVHKNKTYFHIVLDKTPFYAESGGQVGDRGWLISKDEKINVIDTQKENELIIHITTRLPENVENELKAKVNLKKRKATANNHSATHLLHAALRQVLGQHVEQRGSLVDEDHLRFDFSHFKKMTDEEIEKVEQMVNEKIRQNIQLTELRHISKDEATDMGAMAIFGEKYDDEVRVIMFDRDYSIELCGGTHVVATGQIGLFKIVNETAIAAGIRRIEAITSEKAEKYVNEQLRILEEIKETFKNPKYLGKRIKELIDENAQMKKQIEDFEKEKLTILRNSLRENIEKHGEINVIAQKVNVNSAASMKDLAFQLKNQIDNLYMVLGAEISGKANLSLMISENLVKEKGLDAGNIIREAAKEIKGGGGGQPFFATAGGKNTAGIEKAIHKAVEKMKENNVS